MTVGLPNGAFVTSSRSFLRNQKDTKRHPGEKKYTHTSKKKDLLKLFFSDWKSCLWQKIKKSDIILGERDEKKFATDEAKGFMSSPSS